MAIKAPTLRVYPNPWTYIDHLGRPAGVVRFDYHEHATNRGWVGAKIASATELPGTKPVAEIIRGKAFANGRGTAAHDIVWEFSSEPVTLPNTSYYRAAVSNGELIAADKETARVCGITQTFEDPQVHAEKLKALAIEHFDAHNGEGAFQFFADGRQAESEAVETQQRPAPTPTLAKLAKVSASTSDQPKGDA